MKSKKFQIPLSLFLSEKKKEKKKVELKNQRFEDCLENCSKFNFETFDALDTQKRIISLLILPFFCLCYH